MISCQALFWIIFEVLRFSELVSCNLLSASARNLTSSYWFFRFTSQRRLRSHSLSPRLVLEYNTTCFPFWQPLFSLFSPLFRALYTSDSFLRPQSQTFNAYLPYYSYFLHKRKAEHLLFYRCPAFLYQFLGFLNRLFNVRTVWNILSWSYSLTLFYKSLLILSLY